MQENQQLDLFNTSLRNSSATQIIEDLRHLGFSDFKDQRGNFIYVLTPRNERLSAINSILKNIPGTVYDSSASGSSLGAINCGKYKIQIKPIAEQGNKSFGVENELFLQSQINSYISQYGKINVSFSSPVKEVIFNDITHCAHVGRTSEKNAKADIVLQSSMSQYPISLKKDNSEFWAKAETFYGDKARSILENNISNNNVSLVKINHYHKISTDLVFEPGIQDKKFLVFGKDDAMVVKKTFTYQDFNFDAYRNCLNVTSSYVFEDLSDIDSDHSPWFILRNDSSRNSKNIGIRGLTLETVMATRAFGKKNTILVDNPFKN